VTAHEPEQTVASGTVGGVSQRSLQPLHRSMKLAAALLPYPRKHPYQVPRQVAPTIPHEAHVAAYVVHRHRHDERRCEPRDTGVQVQRPRLRLIPGNLVARFLVIVGEPGCAPNRMQARRRYFSNGPAARRYANEQRRRGFACRVVTEFR